MGGIDTIEKSLDCLKSPFFPAGAFALKRIFWPQNQIKRMEFGKAQDIPLQATFRRCRDCRFSMNMFTIDADNLIGANVFGVRKRDLLEGRLSYPGVVTYTNWAPYPGFTIMPSVTQVNHRL